MGDPHGVSDQIEELRHQIRSTAERTEARMAGVEEKLSEMTDAFEKVMTISFRRGEAHADGRLLTVAPDPAPPSEPEPAPLRRDERRRLTAVAVCAVAALLAVAWYAALGEGDAPAAPASGGLTVNRDAVPHGPAWYPVTPRPSPSVTDIGATTGPAARDTGGYGSAYGVRGQNSPATPAPGQTAAPMVAPQPTPEPECRFDVKIRRVEVCKQPPDGQ